MNTPDVRLLCGDARTMLKTLPAESVQCCVTSPPYFQLRHYGRAGQIGQEEALPVYIETLVEVFREVKRVLRKNGCLWLNLGDSYATDRAHGYGLAKKQLLGVPWRVALALQAEGWFLRSDCIWHKPNVQPESATDRPGRDHEYLFLLTRSAHYYYDRDAVREPYAKVSLKDLARRKRGIRHRTANHPTDPEVGSLVKVNPLGRNRRTVWKVATMPGKKVGDVQHFAAYPPELVRPCVLSGSRPGDVVLDPFVGSGTTGVVAVEEGRQFVGIDLNATYLEMARGRIEAVKR